MVTRYPISLKDDNMHTRFMLIDTVLRTKNVDQTMEVILNTYDEAPKLRTRIIELEEEVRALRAKTATATVFPKNSQLFS